MAVNIREQKIPFLIYEIVTMINDMQDQLYYKEIIWNVTFTNNKISLFYLERFYFHLIVGYIQNKNNKKKIRTLGITAQKESHYLQTVKRQEWK